MNRPAFLRVALLAASLGACRRDADPVRTDPRAVDARRAYAEKLDGAYREDGGEVAVKGRYLDTLHLRILKADATWCETFPSPQNRDLLRDLGFRTVVLRNSERQVCRIPLARG